MTYMQRIQASKAVAHTSEAATLEHKLQTAIDWWELCERRYILRMSNTRAEDGMLAVRMVGCSKVLLDRAGDSVQAAYEQLCAAEAEDLNHCTCELDHKRCFHMAVN
jgi:hypothetical protein